MCGSSMVNTGKVAQGEAVEAGREHIWSLKH